MTSIAFFSVAFEILIGHEGGYVSHPNDPGGETKFGISKRSYPAEDIPNITLVRARQIYYRDFWGPAGCDALPPAIKFDMFDTAVNAGPTKAIKLLQQTVGAVPDGILGPATLQAVNSMDPERLVACFNGWRLDFLNDLKTWPSFGRGWAQRIAENLKRI